MKDAIRDFCAQLSNSDTALLYFRGDGTYYSGQTRLLPIALDGKIELIDAENHTISLSSVLEALSAATTQPKLVYLDVARVDFGLNPPVVNDVPVSVSDNNTIVCFSTSPWSGAIESPDFSYASVLTDFFSHVPRS